jgi:tRNA-specific 2-thiouridylase
MNKAEVKKKAKSLGLPVDQAESQNVCFIEDDDYGRFLKEACPEAVKPGLIVDQQGNKVGEHQGVAFYTLGQRKGIGHHRGKPKYVVGIDQERNQVVIGDQAETFGTDLIAEQINYILGVAPEESLEVTAKIRYNSPEGEAVLYPLGKDRAKVVFKKPQQAITPGQSVVFYKGDEIIGGGIIS